MTLMDILAADCSGSPEYLCALSMGDEDAEEFLNYSEYTRAPTNEPERFSEVCIDESGWGRFNLEERP